MKKIFRTLLVLMVGIFLVSSLNVKADTVLVEAQEGASIRTKTEISLQGLRFNATLDVSVKDNEHGFYLVFGETTAGALEAVKNDTNPVLNGKPVFKVVVPGVTALNGFSVVLTGIPEQGYLDKLSAIPYVVVGEEIQLALAPMTRSIGEVALKMQVNAQNAPEGLLDNVRRVGVNAFGQLEITNNLYETNHFHLREEFIKDWNAKFGTTWTELVGSAFHTSASTGNVVDNLSNTNVYKFFKDELYKDKWAFLLDIIELKGAVWPQRQAQAIKGDGTLEGINNLYFASHFNYSIVNYFNASNATDGYDPVNFITKSMYDDVLHLVKGVYINLDKYEFHLVGSQITIPEAPDRTGYDFLHYKLGGVEITGPYTITQDNVVFESVYSPINYNVTFFDGATELTALAKTYNIESALALGSYVKEGYTFLGWYDNALFDGSAITSIPIGSTGHKVYYAKTVEVVNAPVPITYNLDGGNFYKYNSREEMVDDLIADLKIVGNRTQDRIKDMGDPTISAFFADANLQVKWGWLINHIIDLAVTSNHPSKDKLISKDPAIWRWTLDTFTVKEHRTGWPGDTLDFSIEENNNAFWDSSINDVPEEYEFATTLVLPIPIKVGFTFAGWYYEADFSGVAVTQIEEATTETIVLYAKWQ